MSDWMVAWEDAHGMFVNTEFFDTRKEATKDGERPRPLGKGHSVVLYRVTQEQVIQTT
jgi:hypothetical protein